MNSTKIIITHVAMFVAGVVVAVMVYQPLAGQAGGSAATNRDAASNTSGGAAAPGVGGHDGVVHERHDGRALKGKAGETPVQRVAGIVRTGDALERQEALMALVARLGPGEFAAVADQYRNMDHYGRSSGEYEIILRGWAKADPLAALAYAEKNPYGYHDTSLVISSWAGNDAAAAERWAIANYQGDGPNPYLASVIRGIAASDLAHASQLAQTMPVSRERAEAVDAITRALFVQGVEAAMAFPATIPEDKLRAGFVDAIATRLANKDPDKAASWLLASGDADSQSRAARYVAEVLAKENPASATQWLTKLKPEAQAEAARGIIPVMSAKDIAGTASWAASLSGIPGYDKVVEEFVWSCDGRAPEQSAAWIQAVSDIDQRRRLYYQMLGEWAKRDANAVKAWVSNNPVPPDVLRRFTR